MIKKTIEIPSTKYLVKFNGKLYGYNNKRLLRIQALAFREDGLEIEELWQKAYGNFGLIYDPIDIKGFMK